MEIKVLYEDENILVVDKPSGIIVFPENNIENKALIDKLLERYPALKNVGAPPRYGIIHRLDKDTSGILLVAKNNETQAFIQGQFKQGKVIKKYLALVVGNIKESQGQIKTLIGRALKDRIKQQVYLTHQPSSENKRRAETNYKVIERFKDYTLLETVPKTGRKHQIRTHLAYLNHPIAGDKLYGFKSQPCPKGLKRQFLHASYLKASFPRGDTKEFTSSLPNDLKLVLENLKLII